MIGNKLSGLVKSDDKKLKNFQKFPKASLKSKVCVNSKNCMLTRGNITETLLANKHTKCTCPKEYSFECGLNYCSVSKRDCDQISLIMNKFKFHYFRQCLDTNLNF